MKHTFAILFLCVAAFAVNAQVSVKPIDIKQRTLGNGLQVVTVKDSTNPVVTVQVWYKVGGKDDPEGKSGFAHMFEHMMFKATTNMPSESLDRLTEDVGGWNNASTRDDLTNYYEVVPANHLERLLWAEADRMVNLAVTKESFESEREVVKEEYRLRVANSPYGQLFQYLDSLTFKKHPYQRGVIGDLEQLDAATFEDAERFYRTFYRPDNASLIVVGDFDEKQLTEWIDKYFGVIKKPENAIPRVTIKEPRKTEATTYSKTRPIVPLPALGVTYLAPPSNHADIPALELASAILSRGSSSRLYTSIVKERQLAQNAILFTDFRIDEGILAFFSVAAGGKSVEEIEKVFLDEIGKLGSEAPDEKELQKAKNQLIAELISERETANGMAVAIGEAIIYQGDPNAVNTDVAKLEAVTVNDISRVIREYFRPDGRTTIFYKNGPESVGKGDDK